MFECNFSVVVLFHKRPFWRCRKVIFSWNSFSLFMVYEVHKSEWPRQSIFRENKTTVLFFTNLTTIKKKNQLKRLNHYSPIVVYLSSPNDRLNIDMETWQKQ